MPYFLSIDIGTTNVKAGVFDEKGNLLGQRLVEVKVYSDEPGSAVQDLREIFSAVVSASKGLAREARVRVDAVILCSQMHGMAALNDNYEPVSPLYTYLDTRPSKHSAMLESEYGRKIYEETGCPPLFIYPLTKLVWLREARPEEYAKARYFAVSAKDYILYKLTGEFVIDESTASGSQLLSVRTLKWSRVALGVAGIDEDLLPAAVKGDCEIPVRASVAREIGVEPGTPVMPGISDAAAHNAGVGVHSETELALNLGTSAAVRVASTRPVLDSRGMRFFCYYAGYDRWLVGGAINNAGLVFKWFKEGFAHLECCLADVLGTNPYELLEREARLADPVPGGLFFLPYIAGERFPVRDPYARGVLYGLTLRHTKRDVVRAIMEGVAFTLRWIYDAMREEGVSAHAIRASGGGAKSRLWREILSNVFDLPVAYSMYENASLLGNVVFTGLSLGYYRSLEEAVSTICGGRESEIIKPDPNLAKLYSKAYALFRELYGTLREFEKKYHETLFGGA